MIRPARPPARKRWGQNFLIDPNYIRKIVLAIQPQAGDHFLEIGPGHGELTLPIAAEAAGVLAVDIDPWLVEDLRELVPANVDLLNQDILKTDLPQVLPEGARFYGSLPYNITSPVLFRLLDVRQLWRDAAFIVQDEVARRLAAEAGSKTYGRLSVMVQAYCRVEYCFAIPPTAFSPQPKVTSALVRLTPGGLVNAIKDTARFAHVVRLGFGQRRKKLRNALKALDMEAVLLEMGVADLRAEAVPVDEWIQLANQIN